MDGIMERWHDAAKQRASVRKFDSALDRDCFYSLKSFINSNLTAERARLVLLAKNGVLKSTVVPHGKITGTNCFAAVIADKDSEYMAGYLGEALALECIARGYATCWLGTSYNKAAVTKFIKFGSNESICCIIAVGLCNISVKQRKKKSVEQLTGLNNKMFNKLPAWQQAAINCARLAPSALNKQPWELVINDNSIGIINNAYNFGFSEIDKGIAMLHIELGAASEGFYGEWRFDEDIPIFCKMHDESFNEAFTEMNAGGYNAFADEESDEDLRLKPSEDSSAD